LQNEILKLSYYGERETNNHHTTFLTYILDPPNTMKQTKQTPSRAGLHEFASKTHQGRSSASLSSPTAHQKARKTTPARPRVSTSTTGIEEFHGHLCGALDGLLFTPGLDVPLGIVLIKHFGSLSHCLPDKRVITRSAGTAYPISPPSKQQKATSLIVGELVELPDPPEPMKVLRAWRALAVPIVPAATGPADWPP
jgi:hypothetical protein